MESENDFNIKDLDPKVIYHFRIHPQLKRDLQLYANVYGITLPTAINILLRESIRGLTLDNTYFNHEMLISIPPRILTDVSLTKPNKEWLLFEVKKVPNNLDVWTKKRGYTSKHTVYNHEGLSVVIEPNLLMYNPLTKDSILNCLKFLYFYYDNTDNIRCTLIDYKQALTKLHDVGNLETYNQYKFIIKEVLGVAEEIIKDYQKLEPTMERESKYKQLAYDKLKPLQVLYSDRYINKVDLDHEKPTTSPPNTYKKLINKQLEELEARKEELTQLRDSII